MSEAHTVRCRDGFAFTVWAMDPPGMRSFDVRSTPEKRFKDYAALASPHEDGTVTYECIGLNLLRAICRLHQGVDTTGPDALALLRGEAVPAVAIRRDRGIVYGDPDPRFGGIRPRLTGHAAVSYLHRKGANQ